ncbi:MAG: hypothetical protein J1F66_02150 [Clostridiales bacterium]|nr:hypothetical protein [Clostridiales bacterium]
MKKRTLAVSSYFLWCWWWDMNLKIVVSSSSKQRLPSAEQRSCERHRAKAKYSTTSARIKKASC